MTKYIHHLTVETDSSARPCLVRTGERDLNVTSHTYERKRRRYQYEIHATVAIDETARFGCSGAGTLQDHLTDYLRGRVGSCWMEVDERDPDVFVQVTRRELP